jgi:hypothetical protein
MGLGGGEHIEGFDEYDESSMHVKDTTFQSDVHQKTFFQNLAGGNPPGGDQVSRDSNLIIPVK